MSQNPAECLILILPFAQASQPNLVPWTKKFYPSTLATAISALTALRQMSTHYKLDVVWGSTVCSPCITVPIVCVKH